MQPKLLVTNLSALRRRLSRNVLIRGVSVSFVSSILSAGFAFAERAVLARLLGKEIFGEYIYVYSWLVVLMIFGSFGMSMACLRYFAEYAGQEKWGALKGLFRYAFLRTTIYTLITGIFVFGVVFLLRQRLEVTLIHTFLVGLLVLPFLTYSNLISRQLLGIHQIFMSVAPVGFISSIILILLTIIAINVVEIEPSASLLMLTTLITFVLIFILSLYYLLQRVRPLIQDVPVEMMVKQWNGTANRMVLHDLIGIFYQRSGTILIGTFLSTTEAGLYAIAAAVVIIIDFGISSVNSVVAPIIADLYSKGNFKRLQRVLTLTVAGVSIYALAGLVVVIFAGQFILGIFGSDFVQGYPVLIVLAVGKFFNSLTGSVGFMMTMTGHELDAFRIRVMSVIIALAISLVAIPIWGMIGAAVASSLGIIIWNVMLVIRVRKIFNLDPTILSLPGLRTS